MNTTRIVIIDDHPFFREGLKSILGRDEGLSVAAEAGTAREGLCAVKAHAPDIVLLDITLPDASGIELVRKIAVETPGAKCIMLSVHCKAEYIKEAFAAGAVGYVTKDTATDRLAEAIGTVLRGGYYIDSSVSREVVRNILLAPGERARSNEVAYGDLTPREQEIMRLLAEGLNSKDIGQRLFISPKTVDNHRSRIMGKLGLSGMVELVRYAVRIGLVDPESWV